MSEVSQRMRQVIAKLSKVSSRLDALTSENALLKRDLAAAKARNTDLEMRIAALDEDFNRVKLAKTVVTASGDKVEMKFRVNEMVKEIDKCIALLNR